MRCYANATLWELFQSNHWFKWNNPNGLDRRLGNSKSIYSTRSCYFLLYFKSQIQIDWINEPIACVSKLVYLSTHYDTLCELIAYEQRSHRHVFFSSFLRSLLSKFLTILAHFRHYQCMANTLPSNASRCIFILHFFSFLLYRRHQQRHWKATKTGCRWSSSSAYNINTPCLCIRWFAYVQLIHVSTVEKWKV